MMITGLLLTNLVIQGGLGHTMNVENLMTQKKVIQDFDGDYLKATQLNRSQIQNSPR